MSFVNQAAFNDPGSRQIAMGVDLRASTAITHPSGRVLIYAQTGGMINPTRYELQPGALVFRFGKTSAGVKGVAKGGWWIEKPEFEKLVAFAQVWDIAIGMAMRALCLVPPEWSDATLLVRARVTESLLAWRGLANSVVTPAATGGPMVRMPHQNENSERRLHQLFVPGLAGLPEILPGLRVEQEYPLDARESIRGFIYTI
jgi:hypothetical protein